jgi:hypothetical protein
MFPELSLHVCYSFLINLCIMYLRSIFDVFILMLLRIALQLSIIIMFLLFCRH